MSWQLFAASHRRDDPAAADRLLAAYREWVPITDAELAGRESVAALYHAIQAAWAPDLDGKGVPQV
ncbi:hypothetical protein [Actinokineospora iranica]|uniref:hypothetical protein n=1 Tax=Actinokineospora iranica TaxID=1271860 RepID=UPI000B880BF1|nr:hypothetical protein [Actinokineospora iranica]